MAQLSRRSLFGTAAAVMAGSAVDAAPAQPASPDAELLRLCAEHDALEREQSAIYDGPNAIEDDDAAAAATAPIFHRLNELADSMGHLRAVTPAGIQARAHSLALHAGHGNFSFDHPRTRTNRLLHHLLRDAAALGGSKAAVVASNPDAELLALRPQYERLKAQYDAYNAGVRDLGPDEDGGKEFDDFCMKIVGMTPAKTDEGRALKAVAAAHQVVYIIGNPEVSADDGNGPWAAWQVLSELVGGRFAMPGD